MVLLQMRFFFPLQNSGKLKGYVQKRERGRQKERGGGRKVE